MIKSYVIAVTEIDDAEEALRQAREGLAAVSTLKNSVGIVTAHPEFVSSGLYGRIAELFPFPLVGSTSIAHSASGVINSYMLSVLVLTSDDCEFSCGLSDPVSPESSAEAVGGICRKSYEAARAALTGDPKLALLYTPFFRDATHHADDYISALSKANEDLPIFGATANDDEGSLNAGADGSRVLFGGKEYGDRFAMTLVCGAVSPKFYVISFAEESLIMPKIGVVTAAEKNVLLEINNIKAVEFFKNVGFLSGGAGNFDTGMLSSTFVLHHPGGREEESCARIPTQIMGGSIRCGGEIVAGATLSVAFNTKESVLGSAERLITRVREEGGGGTAIMISCLGRRYGLLNEPMKELEVIRDIVGGKMAYTAGYVNGEICPIVSGSGKARNMYHNQTLAVCVF